jgi:hypothetical protein
MGSGCWFPRLRGWPEKSTEQVVQSVSQSATMIARKKAELLWFEVSPTAVMAF